MKHFKILGGIALASLLFTGCTFKTESTPAVMTYDGSNVDYSRIDELKKATVCKYVTAKEGDTTIIAAAKAGGIKKIKHVDTSFVYDTFFGMGYGYRNCVTVYGE